MEKQFNVFEEDMKDQVFFIPFTHAHLVGAIRKKARVIKEAHEEDGTYLTVRGKKTTLEWVVKLLKIVEA